MVSLFGDSINIFRPVKCVCYCGSQILVFPHLFHLRAMQEERLVSLQFFPKVKYKFFGFRYVQMKVVRIEPFCESTYSTYSTYKVKYKFFGFRYVQMKVVRIFAILD